MMKNLFDIFKQKLSGAEFPGKEKNWKELEKRLNAGEATKGAGFFPSGLVLSLLIGLGGFVLLFPALMNDNKTKFFNPFNSNTVQVIANNGQRIEKAKSLNNAGEPKANQPKATPAAESKIVEENVATSAPLSINRHNSFVRIAIPSGGYATAKDPDDFSTAAKKTGNNFSTGNFEKDPDQILPTSETFSANTNNTKGILDAPHTSDLTEITALPYLSLRAGNETALYFPAKQDVPDYFSKCGLGFKVGLQAGLQFSNPKLNVTGENETWKNRVSKEEKGLISTAAGIDFQISKKGWNFSTGLNYFTQGEQRNYSNDFVQTAGRDSFFYSSFTKNIMQFDTTYIALIEQQNVWVMSDTVVTYYNEQTGTFVTSTVPMIVMVNNGTDTTYTALIDTGFVTVQDTILNGTWVSRDFRGENENLRTLLKGKNSFSYLEIPLMVGYDWRIKSLSVGLKAGVGIGRLVSQSAYYLSDDERRIQPYLIEQNKQMLFSFILRPNVAYWFGKHWGVECSPSMRMRLNKMGGSADTRNTYRNYGLMGGINYRW